MDNNKMILAVVLGVIVLGGGVYLATRDTNETQTDQQSTTMSQTESPMASEVRESKDIVTLASETSDLSTLVTAVKAADLVSTLQGSGPFTVFAPTNAAFEALPAGTVETLLKPENKSQLQGVLTYHVVPAKALSKDLKDGQVLTTAQGSKITVSVKNGEVMLTDATGGMSKVVQADIEAKNGVVHVIDSVVLPQ